MEGPLTADLRAQLGAHRPSGWRERAAVATVLAALDRLAAPYDEHRDLTHVTGSAIVAGARGVVLHRHKRLGVWLQPGGHLDPGEQPWDAARREAAEETGLEVRHPPGGPVLVHVDVHAGPRGHVHLDCRYLVLAADDDPSPPEDESQDVRWFTWDAADAAVGDDPGLRVAFAVARRHLGLLA